MHMDFRGGVGGERRWNRRTRTSWEKEFGPFPRLFVKFLNAFPHQINPKIASIRPQFCCNCHPPARGPEMMAAVNRWEGVRTHASSTPPRHCRYSFSALLPSKHVHVANKERESPTARASQARSLLHVQGGRSGCNSGRVPVPGAPPPGPPPHPKVQQQRLQCNGQGTGTLHALLSEAIPPEELQGPAPGQTPEQHQGHAPGQSEAQGRAAFPQLPASERTCASLLARTNAQELFHQARCIPSPSQCHWPQLRIGASTRHRATAANRHAAVLGGKS